LLAQYAPLFSKTKPGRCGRAFACFGLAAIARATRNFDSGVAIVEGREGFGVTGAA